MTKTTDLLDAAKVASGCDTDYQFAKRFRLTVQTVSTWRQGKSTFSDNHAAMIAEILGREAGEVMALCAAERAKTEAERSRWLRVAALVAAAVIPPAAGAQSGGNSDNQSKGIGIMSTLRRVLLPVPLVRYG